MSSLESIRPNLDKIVLSEKTIYIVGTAHVSQQSADLARDAIQEFNPSSVAVELCESRMRSLKNPDRWKNTNIVDVIRQGKTYALLAQLMLASFQKRLGQKLNVQPGSEMMAAVKAAEDRGAEVVLADRDISITLKRTWVAIGWIRLFKLIYQIVKGLFDKHEISAEEIERLKSQDALSELMREFSEAMPTVRTALIDERDKYLAEKIRNAPGPVVVAIVGAAHVPGISHWIKEETDLAPLMILPKKGRLTALVGWSVPVLIIAGFIYSFMVAGSDAARDMLVAWFWITGLFGAVGAAVAAAHPFTVIAAFIAAPFASLNPFIAAGWVAGIVEAVVRKPRVSDLENIADDLSSLKGIYTNHVSRTLLIVASTNIFVMIGMAVGAHELVSFMSGGH